MRLISRGILCTDIVPLEFYIPRLVASHPSLFVLAVPLVFLGVAEVVDENKRATSVVPYKQLSCFQNARRPAYTVFFEP